MKIILNDWPSFSKQNKTKTKKLYCTHWKTKTDRTDRTRKTNKLMMMMMMIMIQNHTEYRKVLLVNQPTNQPMMMMMKMNFFRFSFQKKKKNIRYNSCIRWFSMGNALNFFFPFSNHDWFIVFFLFCFKIKTNREKKSFLIKQNSIFCFVLFCFDKWQ